MTLTKNRSLILAVVSLTTIGSSREVQAGTYAESLAAAVTPITPTDGFAWYNPTAITIHDASIGGDYLYVYVQGGPNVGEPCNQPPEFPQVRGDSIHAFRALINAASGEPGAFSYVGRITPCVPPPSGLPAPPLPQYLPHAFWGPGQVFKSRIDGFEKYYLLADASDSWTFREVWLGSSLNGKDWTWNVSSISSRREESYGSGATARTIAAEPAAAFMKSALSPDIYLLNPIVQVMNYGQPNEYWWGFFNWLTPLPELASKIGQLKVTRASGSLSVSVLSSKAPYQYTALAGGNTLGSFIPVSLKNGAGKSLIWSDGEGSYELWGGTADQVFEYGNSPIDVGCNTALTSQCLTPPDPANQFCTLGCQTGDSGCVAYGEVVNNYLYNTGVAGPAIDGHGSAFAWWRVSESAFDPTDRLLQEGIRPLPGVNEIARLFPARWDAPSGSKYLFSASNDLNLCGSLLFSPYYKMYVVRTKLDYTPSPSTRTLTVTRSGSGSGTVTSSPTGITCGSDCQQDYSTGQVVALTPQWNAGSNFAGWSGDADCADGSVTMSVARTCIATFNTTFGINRTLTISKSGTGGGTVTSHPTGVTCGGDCSQSYPSGTVVVLISQPAAGSTFAGWTGVADCLDGRVTMGANRSCTAVFNASSSTASLSVFKSGTGGGTVTSIPAGIDCGTDCHESYSIVQPAVSVVLKFSAAAGSTFSFWDGDADCSDGNLSMSANRDCTATFNSSAAATAHVDWIQPGPLAHFGPQDGLVIAGTAAGAPSGTPVLLRWRNATTGGSWVIETYPPTPDPVTGIWYHSIAPANFNQQFDVYVSYGSVTAPICTYQGSNAITWCP